MVQRAKNWQRGWLSAPQSCRPGAVLCKQHLHTAQARQLSEIISPQLVDREVHENLSQRVALLPFALTYYYSHALYANSTNSNGLTAAG